MCMNRCINVSTNVFEENTQQTILAIIYTFFLFFITDAMVGAMNCLLPLNDDICHNGYI